MKLFIVWHYDGYEEPEVFTDPEEALLYVAGYEQRKVVVYEVTRDE